jgi:beta-glucuronidase
MKRILILLLLLSASASTRAGSGDPIANVGSRTTISMDGTWRAIIDPYETGLGSRFYEDRKPKNKQDLVEYDFDASETLNVPGDWNSQRESLFFYEGPVWYRRLFSYSKREHVRSFIYFGAANYWARVYLNGKKLGEHEGGFTPFDFEITDVVHEGSNSLVVEVDNTRHKNGIPGLNTDWWNYGGLTRSVEIVEVPEIFIQDYSVQLAKGSASEISGWVRFEGATKPEQVTIEIPEAGVKKVVTTGEKGYAEFHFPAKIELWSPQEPKLYRVVISSSDDKVEDQIGFRTVEARGTQILLNGKPIFLRGVSVHEEAPFRGGRSYSAEDDQVILGWAKELGCNFVRLAHYPHNEAMIRLADKLGVLVWSEIPVYWGIEWQDPATLDNAKSQLGEMISRDRNRAAVVLWSIGNETPIVPARLEFMKQLAATARQLDSTRLLTAAMNITSRAVENTRVLNDPLGEFVDVLGLNEYIGWYEGRPEDADRTEWKSSYDKPLIVSEFGAGALYGNHGDAEARWTEEYQVRVYEHQIQMLRNIPFLAGMSPWVLMDFHSARRPLPAIQDFHNRKGLISDRGQRKQAFYVLQKFYREMSQAGK